MRYTLALAALAASAHAAAIPQAINTAEADNQAMFTLELGPDDVRVVTEDEKWALKAAGVNFFDITEQGVSHPIITRRSTFPSTLQHTTAVKSLIPSLSTVNLKSTLTTLANFHNRYYTSTYGRQSATWLKSQADAIIAAAAAPSAAAVTSRLFTHSWSQPSIIVTIPGKSAKTVVIGAHQDSIGSGSNRASARAPGADDDGSGCVTILETLRVLLSDKAVAAGEAENTIEFHWYSGEEAGLLGSQAVFNDYARKEVDVVAMLNQDMTGYWAPGTTEQIGLIVDNVDAGLTTFIKTLIEGYNRIGWTESECGYACSDHASANKVGFPAALAFESAFEDSSPYIHAATDTVDHVDFNHMLEFTKLCLAFAYELGFNKF